MTNQQITIYTATDFEQAHLLGDLLETEGIAAVVAGDECGCNKGPASCGSGGRARVMVAADDAGRARSLAEEFAKKPSPRRAALEEMWQRPSGDVLPAWPACPVCDKPRIAVCPYCKTSGSQLPPADLPKLSGGGDVEQVLWLCPVCDEPFESPFLRRCEWCGHDFGSGIQAEPEMSDPEVNRRVLAAMVTLIGVLLVVAVYFALLLPSR